MKENNCSIFKLLSCLLAIVFVSLLISHFSPPAHAAVTGGTCTKNEDCASQANPSDYCDLTLAVPKCVHPTGSILDSSLKKFQTIVKKSEEKGETNLQWYLGSSNGSIEATTNSLTGLIVGNNIDWDALAQGNFQNANIAGAFGFTSNLVAQVLTKPPVSSREYFADLGRNFGIVKPAYAQGIGFKGLSNLLPIWKATRNLSYILFVIVFLATGLAVMFRVKLDPKTVVTIQNAIPKLIIALILVTFSYAIVGLLIDFMYLIIYLGVLALAGPTGLDVIAEQAKYTSLGFFDAVGLIFGGGIEALFTSGTTIISGGVVAAILGVLGVLLAGTGIGAVVAALPLLIFAIVALFLIIKLFFSLLMCYINIILSVIIAPLQIMMGALPGSSMGFSSWFKNLLANILVFPAVALFFLLGWLLTAKNYGPEWTPPVLGVGGGSLTALLGLGMLLLVNKIPQMVKSAFKMAKPVEYGTAIGAAFGPAKTGATVAGGEVIGTGGHMEKWGGPWTARAQTLRKVFKFR